MLSVDIVEVLMMMKGNKHMDQLYPKTYSGMLNLSSFDERFNYLALHQENFSYHLNDGRSAKQAMYRSKQWKMFKRKIIIRDHGCELALDYMPINESIYIHHINPITTDDIIQNNYKVFDPENVICVSYAVHYALHYADLSYIKKILSQDKITERTKYDTCPWKRI